MNVSDLKILAKSLGFKEKQDADETGWFSAYKREGNTLVRLSDHRVKLRTILNNNKPELPQNIISIVALCGDENIDKQKNDTMLPQNADFYVTQYEYDFTKITDTKDLISIQNDIKVSFSNGSYPNNELPISKQKPNPIYVTKQDSNLIDVLNKKVKKRGGTIVHESFSFHIPSFEEFSQIYETKTALVGVTFYDENGVKRNTSDDLPEHFKKPWAEQFHYEDIDNGKYVWDGAQEKYLVKGLEQYGEMRETQWFVHEKGTIVPFRIPATHEYIFAETDTKLEPLFKSNDRVSQWKLTWHKLDVIPEWVLKHFSILEFVGGVDIDCLY